MGDKAITAIVAIVTGVLTIAIVAVLVSGQSQTASVITAAGKSFSGILQTAVSPVSASGLPNLGSNTIGIGFPFLG